MIILCAESVAFELKLKITMRCLPYYGLRIQDLIFLSFEFVCVSLVRCRIWKGDSSLPSIECIYAPVYVRHVQCAFLT